LAKCPCIGTMSTHCLAMIGMGNQSSNLNGEMNWTTSSKEWKIQISGKYNLLICRAKKLHLHIICRRTIKDPMTGQDVVLSEKDLALVKRLQENKIPNANHDEYKVIVNLKKKTIYLFNFIFLC